MSCCMVSLVALVVVCLVLLWCLIHHNSVKVYRFYRPTCPYCVSSQAEWDQFKSDCRFRMVRCIDVNMDALDADEKRLVDNFAVASVPTVVAVLTNGERYQHDTDRTAVAYKAWLDSKA